MRRGNKAIVIVLISILITFLQNNLLFVTNSSSYKQLINFQSNTIPTFTFQYVIKLFTTLLPANSAETENWIPYSIPMYLLHCCKAPLQFILLYSTPLSLSVFLPSSTLCFENLPLFSYLL